ncbi:MAG: STAS domain-containing protein [Marmoricola sp.]
MELYRDGAILEVRGQVDGRGTAELRDGLHQLLEQHGGNAVLDLTDVDSVDLTALRTIAVASRSATLDGQHLRLRGCSPLVRRLLLLAHLRGLIEFDPEPSAV